MNYKEKRIWLENNGHLTIPTMRPCRDGGAVFKISWKPKDRTTRLTVHGNNREHATSVLYAYVKDVLYDQT